MHTADDAAVCSIKYKYYKGATIYIRSVNIERDGEQYGTYYQAVRSYREQGKVKQEVIHLREHTTAESALEAWPREIQKLRRMSRPKKAKILERKLEGAGANGGEMMCYRFTDLIASKA